jgi:hypothetical protein
VQPAQDPSLPGGRSDVIVTPDEAPAGDRPRGTSPVLDGEVEPARTDAPSDAPLHRHGRIASRSSKLAAALRDVPPGLSPFWRRALVVLLVVQLAVIVTAGLVTVFQFHFMAPIDEETHFSYVQQIAEHGSLPVLGKTETSLQGLAMVQGIYPRPTTVDPKKIGVWGLDYEAYQPPLYYIAAVPAFDATPNFIDKVYSIRLFDAVLLFISVGLVGRLARVALKERWLIGWSVALVFFALPGLVVRFVTVSNLALAVPLAILFGTELWIAWERHSVRRLAIAGALTGLCILTELQLLVMVPVFALVLVAEAHRCGSARSIRTFLAVLLIPLVLVAPWLAFNEAHFHMLTAGPIAIKEQDAIINPQHQHYSISQLPNDTVSVVDPTLPAEWTVALRGQPALSYLDQLLAFLVVPAAAILAVALGRRLWSIPTAILGLPWVLTFVELWYIRYGQQWSILARYLYPTMPIFLVLVAQATDAFRARFRPVLISAAATGALISIWGYFLFAYSGQFALR